MAVLLHGTFEIRNFKSLPEIHRRILFFDAPGIKTAFRVMLFELLPDNRINETMDNLGSILEI